jgi:hypothetical protein
VDFGLNLNWDFLSSSIFIDSFGGAGGGSLLESGSCVTPNLLQKAGIAAQGFLARFTGKAIGLGAGVSVAAGGGIGKIGGPGITLSMSRQVVVTPNGQASFVTSVTNMSPSYFNSVVVPTGAGIYGGIQASVSNAVNRDDLHGPAVDYGVGGGRGWAGGVDLSVGGVNSNGNPSWQLNFTGGLGAGGIGHGLSITTSNFTPICGG